MLCSKYYFLSQQYHRYDTPDFSGRYIGADLSICIKYLLGTLKSGIQRRISSRNISVCCHALRAISSLYSGDSGLVKVCPLLA